MGKNDQKQKGRPGRSSARSRIILLSRALTLIVVATSLGTLFWQPKEWWTYGLDVLFRSYVIFLGTVMGHEATHGHLGRTSRVNAWWGRLALLPSMVTYSKFRRTHLLHHAHTNDPQRDPDYLLATHNEWEIPFRAVAMPHHWLFWLRRHDKLHRGDVADHLVNGLAIVAFHAVLLLLVGWWRFVTGVFPALILVSLILWYPFGVKTHEGWSRGPAESRSHNYYGRLMFWLSWGLSMHRLHHMNPSLTWLELKQHVEPASGSWWRRWLPQRDIVIAK